MGNKIDLEQECGREVEWQEVDDYASSIRAVAVETSALTAVGIVFYLVQLCSKHFVKHSLGSTQDWFHFFTLILLSILKTIALFYKAASYNHLHPLFSAKRFSSQLLYN